MGAKADTPFSLTDWMRARRASLALWKNDDYRRDAMRLLVMDLRGMFGLKLGAALLLLAAAGAYILWTEVTSPLQGYDLLLRLFGVATMLAAAPIYAADQRQGTFELLWLATGSQGALLRRKVVTLLIALTLLMVPSVLFVSWFLYGTLPAGKVLVFLVTNSLFIIALMALAGTLMPQAWAGALAASAFLVVTYVVFSQSLSALNPFLNPLAEGTIKVGGGAFAGHAQAQSVAGPNRVILIIISVGLLVGAKNRLKRAFR